LKRIEANLSGTVKKADEEAEDVEEVEASDEKD
jgi:hypothetical protein